MRTSVELILPPVPHPPTKKGLALGVIAAKNADVVEKFQRDSECVNFSKAANSARLA